MGYVEYSPLDSGFYAFLGTPNGASTVRMLLDHKDELQGRLIDKIVVLGDKDLTFAMSEPRSVIIFLHPRSPPE